MNTGWHRRHCEKCNTETWHADVHCVVCLGNTKCEKHGILLHSCFTCNMKPSVVEVRGKKADSLTQKMLRNAERRQTQIDLSDDLLVWGLDVMQTAPVDSEMRDPDKHYCTFCGAETAQINLTKETRTKIKREVHATKDNLTGIVSIEEAYRAQLEKVQACPNCSLEVQKPVEAFRV